MYPSLKAGHRNPLHPEMDRVYVGGEVRGIEVRQLRSLLLSLGQGDGKKVSQMMYDYSHQCGHIDLFISHSWNASDVLKLLCILLRFYGNYILLMTLASCLVLQYVISCPPTIVMAFAPVMVIISSYCLLRCPIFGRSVVFLDWACIHQTNSKLRLDGIAKIGQSVARSRSFAMCWSEDYNQRLWCLFELALFLSTRKWNGCCRSERSSFFTVPSPEAKLEIWALPLVEDIFIYASFQYVHWLFYMVMVNNFSHSTGSLSVSLIDLIYCIMVSCKVIYVDAPHIIKLNYYMNNISLDTLYCACPKDRENLLAAIKVLYGNVENFLDHVRAMYPALPQLWGNNGYSHIMTYVICFPQILVFALLGTGFFTTLAVSTSRLLLHILVLEAPIIIQRAFVASNSDILSVFLTVIHFLFIRSARWCDDMEVFRLRHSMMQILPMYWLLSLIVFSVCHVATVLAIKKLVVASNNTPCSGF